MSAAVSVAPYPPSTNAVRCVQCGDWLAYYAKSFWTGNYGPRCERCHRVSTEPPNVQRSEPARTVDVGLARLVADWSEARRLFRSVADNTPAQMMPGGGWDRCVRMWDDFDKIVKHLEKQLWTKGLRPPRKDNMNDLVNPAGSPAPTGSALVSLPTHLKDEIQKLIRAAWRDGFEAEDDVQIDYFDGFAVARELLAEPRRVCCECSLRLCDGEEDEMCRECWDASIARCNANREARIAAGWMVGPDVGLVPPNATGSATEGRS